MPNAPIDAEYDTTERVVSDDAQSLRILSIGLNVVDGPARGRRVGVRDGVARVGSAQSNDLRLNDPTVSRVHCEIRVRSDTILVRDCGSTNGTYVEGIKIQEGEVRPGALIRVGSSAFRIEDAGGSVFLPISDRSSFGECVGSSLEMRRLYATLERVAPTSSTVLIEGETGTGKDVVARSIHAASLRANKPFIAIDCGAISVSLIESELFGHVRGAFSGALGDRQGVFEGANGGTLFLDEIGELPLHVQPKLLRVIEARAVRRIGSNTEKPVDVRIVAATNRSLAACVNEGTFREDLYYRLAVVEATLPPLRARREDIATLARHFYERLGGTEPLTAGFLSTLAARGWPGNVRELRNYIERHVSLGLVNNNHELGPEILAAQATDGLSEAALEGLVPLHLPLKEARDAWTERFESIYARALMRKANGNLTRAAEMAGVNRRFMQRLLSRLGMRGGGGDATETDDPVE